MSSSPPDPLIVYILNQQTQILLDIQRRLAASPREVATRVYPITMTAGDVIKLAIAALILSSALRGGPIDPALVGALR